MADADDNVADPDGANADDGQRIAVWRVSRVRLASVDLAELSAAPDATGRLASLGARRVWVGERAVLGGGPGGARVELIDAERVAALQARMGTGEAPVPFDAQGWRAPLGPGEAELWVEVPRWRPDPHPDAWPVGTVFALIVAFVLGLLGLYEVLFDR